MINGFAKATTFEKIVAAELNEHLVNGIVPKHRTIADTIASKFQERVSTSKVSIAIDSLTQLGLIERKGKWRDFGSTVTITPKVAMDVTKWYESYQKPSIG